MILGFTIAQTIVVGLAGVWAIIVGLAGRKPNDVTVLSLVLVEVLLVAQAVVMAIAPTVGNAPTGSLLEAWMYLVAALVIPPAAVVWSLVERTQWSNVVLGAAALTIAVMLWRLQQIWTVQLA